MQNESPKMPTSYNIPAEIMQQIFDYLLTRRAGQVMHLLYPIIQIREQAVAELNTPLQGESENAI